MKAISVSDAFSNAPPRSAAVLCVKGAGGRTDMLLTEWFTWLNFKRNPMISFSLPKNSEIGSRLRNGDSFVLAFPLLTEAKRYQQPVSADADGQEPETMAADALPVRVPKGSEVLLRCTLAGAYNYPFKKVRIFNCNLEEALGCMDSKKD